MEMASRKAEEKKEPPENKEQLEKPKEAVVRGIPCKGVIVASGDGFGTKEFSAAELEAAVRHGVALERSPVRPLRTASRLPQPQL